MASIPIKTREELTIENLRDLKEVFDKFSVEFWLNWGIVLGAVRDGKLMSWDHDVDLAAKEKEHGKIMRTLPELKKRGFIVRELAIPVPKEEFLYRKFAFYRDGDSLDLGLYHLKGEHFMGIAGPYDLGNSVSDTITKGFWLLWHALTSYDLGSDSRIRAAAEHLARYCLFIFPRRVKNYLTKAVKKILLKRNYCRLVQQILIPKRYYEKLDKIQFYGITFNIPSTIEDFLRYRYGEDWKVIKKNNWDPRHDEVIKPLEGC